MNQDLLRVRGELLSAREALLRQRGDHREGEGELLGVREPDHVDAGAAEGGAIPLDSLNESERSRVGEIEEAIARLDRGDYGACVDCEEAIDPRRLAALPWAKRCFSCQTAFDREHRGAPVV
jgi:DnaK suppressor protein